MINMETECAEFSTEAYLALLKESVGTEAAMRLCIRSAKRALEDEPELCGVEAAERYLKWYRELYAEAAEKRPDDTAKALQDTLCELFRVKKEGV